MTEASVSEVRSDTRGRLSRVDALRAIAVLLVMVHHLRPPPEYAHPAAIQLIELVRRPSWFGVDLFFVLSGFLVSGLLLREYQQFGDLKVGRFLVRRGFKIYPSFYAFLLTTFFFGAYPQRVPQLEDFIRHALFVQNYADWQPGVWVHTWSLAFEEHFYFLLAAFMAWKLRPAGGMPTLRQAVTGFVVAALLVILARVITTYGVLTDPDQGRLQLHFFATHLRIDSLLFGVLLSYLYHVRPDAWERLTRVRWRLIVAIPLLLAPAFVLPGPDPFTMTIGYTMYYLAFGALLALALPSTRVGAVASSAGSIERMLAMIGGYSYSIYLWHAATKAWSAPIYTWVTGDELGYVEHMLLYFVSSIVFGILMAKLIELPFLKWREARYSSRGKTVEIVKG